MSNKYNILSTFHFGCELSINQFCIMTIYYYYVCELFDHKWSKTYHLIAVVLLIHDSWLYWIVNYSHACPFWLLPLNWVEDFWLMAPAVASVLLLSVKIRVKNVNIITLLLSSSNQEHFFDCQISVIWLWLINNALKWDGKIIIIIDCRQSHASNLLYHWALLKRTDTM